MQLRVVVLMLLALTLASLAPVAVAGNTTAPTLPGLDDVSWQEMAALSLAAGGKKASCYNPLFKTHWTGKSDIRHLASRPQMQQGLRLCPAYNARKGCCLNSFEDVLSKAFQRWVAHWKKKSRNIKDFQVQMAKVRVSQAYVKADKLQRALFDKAMDSFAPVIKWHGTCFDSLLEYMAGMLCFACDPVWGTKVFLGQEGRSVEHLNVHDNSNEAVWQSCRRLGAAAAEMQTRVADSLLVKTVWESFEDLSMFNSKITVSQYMARLGLLPIRGSNELLLVLTPGGGNAPGSQARRLALSTPSDFVDPVRAGRTSGFQCAVFPRIPFGVGISVTTLVFIPWLVVVNFIW